MMRYLNRMGIFFLALFLMLSGVTSAIAVPSPSKDETTVYYAHDKGERLKVVKGETGEIVAPWSFCLDERHGTPSYSSKKKVGEYRLISNANADTLDAVLANAEGGRALDLRNPEFSKDQRFEMIKRLIYSMERDPLKIQERYNFPSFRLWAAQEELVYNIVNTKKLTSIYGEAMKELDAFMRDPQAIPSGVEVVVDIYEAQRPKRGKETQSLITGRVITPKVVNPVGSLKTTVKADSVAATGDRAVSVLGDKAVAGVPVVDTITYTGLVAGAQYKVTGTLMKVDGETVTPVANAVVSKTLAASDNGAGTWDIDFGTVKLEAGTTYVVYESAVSVEDLVDADKDGVKDAKHVVEHKDKTDKSQTVVTTPKVVNPVGSLKTTVKADSVAATGDRAVSVLGDKAVAGVPVVDTITYTGLVAGAQYKVTGTLMKVDGETVTPVANAVVSKTLAASDNGAGTWDIDFGTVKLEAGTTYVVYESAVSVEDLVDADKDGVKDAKHVVEHKDKTDKSQTVVTTPKVVNPVGSLKTTVKADSVAATGDRAVSVLGDKAVAGVPVVDTITYTGLVAGAQYKVTGTLMKVDGETVTPVANAVVSKTLAASDNGAGTWDIDFGTVKLEAGTTYVVYESAVSVEDLVDADKDGVKDAKHVVEHKDKTDKSQTVVTTPKVVNPVGSLKTTVKADSVAATGDRAVSVLGDKAVAGVPVVDTITYTGLVAGAQYKVTGTLMKVDGETVTPVANAVVSKTLAASDNGAGTWDIDFGTVKLEAGTTYVVYESAVSVEDLVDADKDGVKDAKHVVEHKDKTDKSQTVVTTPKVVNPVGSLKTTVKADSVAATGDRAVSVLGDKAVAGVPVVDTITYTGLVAGAQYKVTGTLMKVDGETVTPVANAVVSKTLAASDNGAGTWDIDFGTVKLEAGTTYVVYESAVSVEDLVDADKDGVKDAKHVVEHKDKTDKSQTVVTTPKVVNPVGSLKTTVKADSVAATGDRAVSVLGDKAVAGVPVVDTITYTGLVAGAQYKVTGTLMKVDGETVTPVANAVVSKTLAASDNGAGTWDIDFGTVKLEAGTTYVVYESAVSVEDLVDADKDGVKDAKHVVEHKDKTDKSQTVVTTPKVVNPVGSLKTTVKADSVAATGDRAVSVLGDKAVAGVPVVDTITYTGLVAGAQYKVTGTLMKVDGETVTPVANAVVSKTLAASDNGAGTWDIDFGTVKLEAGTTYVVYESAVSVEDLVDADKDGVKDAKHVVEHKDKTDKSQTVVTTPKGNVAPPSKTLARTGVELPLLLLLGIVMSVSGGILLINRLLVHKEDNC
ncbi:VaFE repeat-containing surface-anchored protein [Arcanobacterium phocisimile]|uniref:VaFE repeat-containing surface-anchored protein n=1 Tax=Arcanobacterium phocisimile TaxID=1302235 RepID=A0ABX7IJ49_9ACTO|nr:VaFE repeat-containing surface-anchored protein [Arcanobacterium phocisimile]QRV02120.1 VaFE repeat-containing surface-anchored protein [Arcanobacterium phocisimile]